MSVAAGGRGIAVGLVAAAWLAVFVLAASVPVAVPGSTSAAPQGAVTPTFQLCPGALLAHNYSGTVTVANGSAPPPVQLEFGFQALVVQATSHGTLYLSSTCANRTAVAMSAPGGAFATSIFPVLWSNCTGPNSTSGPCTEIEAPYGNVSVQAEDLPAGDFAVAATNGTNFSVRLAPYLDRVDLDPAPGTTAFSPDAVDTVTATAFTGLGNATGGSVEYRWSLSGSGWSLLGPATGRSANVTAAPGAGVGNLTVLASVGRNGATFLASTGETLVAVPTAVSSVVVNRTTVDIGEPLRVSVNGTGAAGYSYALTIAPGLGTASTTVPCTNPPPAGGRVEVSCGATFAYSNSGVAIASATLSNGYSEATEALPDLTVAAPPSVAIDPGVLVGYTNDSIPLSVAAAAGTGTAPFEEACLDPGAGRTVCEPGPGPAWAFAPEYDRAGNFTATAWTIDATGTNRTASALVHVVAPLAVAVGGLPPTGAVGAPIALRATVAGGDLPARFWWNASGTGTPIAAGTIGTDGSLAAEYVPDAIGPVTFTLSIVDALGSLVVQAASVEVGVGAATQAVPLALPPSTPVTAGVPFGVAWQAYDAGGDAVRSFASAAEIELVDAGTGHAAAGTVSAADGGALPSPLPGWFDVPAGAWLAGELNVSVAADAAGPTDVDLVVAAPLPAGATPVAVTVVADRDHLALSDPTVVLAGARTNATLYRVTDRFGNPAPGAALFVTASWPGGTQRTVVPVVAGPDGSSVAWVNYSIPGAWAATVTVTDLAGDPLLAPLPIPGLAGPFAYLPVVPLTVAGIIGPAIGGYAFARRRRGARAAPARNPDPADEAELQRLAEGQAEIVELVRRAGPIDLAGLATLWPDDPPPPDLADWVASLLTDGTLDARFGADGVARFVLPAAPGPGPSVTVDVAAFDAGAERRDALEAEWAGDDP